MRDTNFAILFLLERAKQSDSKDEFNCSSKNLKHHITALGEANV